LTPTTVGFTKAQSPHHHVLQLSTGMSSRLFTQSNRNISMHTEISNFQEKPTRTLKQLETSEILKRRLLLIRSNFLQLTWWAHTSFQPLCWLSSSLDSWLLLLCWLSIWKVSSLQCKKFNQEIKLIMHLLLIMSNQLRCQLKIDWLKCYVIWKLWLKFNWY